MTQPAPIIDWTRIPIAGARIACSQMSAEPQVLLGSLAEALQDASSALAPAAVVLGAPFSTTALALPPGIPLEVFGGMGAAATMARDRPLVVLPVNYDRCAQAVLARGVDIALVSLARDPASGGLYLGACHGFAIEAARTARAVIVEVNAQAPCIHGGEWPSDLQVHAIVEADYPIASPAAVSVSPTDTRIAAHVASLVADGATIQVGIGSLPSALLRELRGHRRLGIHSGMLTPSLWELIECGAADDSAKHVDTGVAVCGTVYGDAALYRAVDRTHRVALRAPPDTHGHAAISRLPQFTAINSALEVDLGGQMNLDSVGGRLIGGIGGINNFVRGALASRGGRSIIALPSRRRVRGHETASIVASLSGPATVCAADADFVVTEYGVAALRDASVGERRLRLIAIAHPDDRENLTAAAG